MKDEYNDGFRLGQLDFLRNLDPRFIKNHSEFARGYFDGYCWEEMEESWLDEEDFEFLI
ncbi:hypothetical protein H8D91_01920 [archaeon]|nr:hypothetical protein [archaeon]